MIAEGKGRVLLERCRGWVHMLGSGASTTPAPFFGFEKTDVGWAMTYVGCVFCSEGSMSGMCCHIGLTYTLGSRKVWSNVYFGESQSLVRRD